MAERNTTVLIGADDAALSLKDLLKQHLEAKGCTVPDYSATQDDDYPDVAYKLAKDIAAGKAARGILVCGTGIGMAITANKVAGVRAAQAHDTYSAERARKSNNAQIIALGSRVVGPELAKSIVDAWLASEFEGGNSQRKVDKMIAIDNSERDRDDIENGSKSSC